MIVPDRRCVTFVVTDSCHDLSLVCSALSPLFRSPSSPRLKTGWFSSSSPWLTHVNTTISIMLLLVSIGFDDCCANLDPDQFTAGSNAHLAPSSEHLPTSYPPSFNDGRGMVDSYYENAHPQHDNHYPHTPQDPQWDSRSVKSYATHHSQEHLNPPYEMTLVDHAPPVPQLQYQAQPNYPNYPPPNQGYNNRSAPYSPRPQVAHQPSSGGWSATREKMMRRRVRSTITSIHMAFPRRILTAMNPLVRPPSRTPAGEFDSRHASPCEHCKGWEDQGGIYSPPVYRMHHRS